MSPSSLFVLSTLLLTCSAFFNGDSRFPVFRDGTNFVCRQKLNLKDFRDWKMEKVTVEDVVEMFDLRINDFIIINPEIHPISRNTTLNGHINEKTQFCVAGYWRAK